MAGISFEFQQGTLDPVPDVFSFIVLQFEKGSKSPYPLHIQNMGCVGNFARIFVIKPPIFNDGKHCELLTKSANSQ